VQNIFCFMYTFKLYKPADLPEEQTVSISVMRLRIAVAMALRFVFGKNVH